MYNLLRISIVAHIVTFFDFYSITYTLQSVGYGVCSYVILFNVIRITDKFYSGKTHKEIQKEVLGVNG